MLPYGLSPLKDRCSRTLRDDGWFGWILCFSESMWTVSGPSVDAGGCSWSTHGLARSSFKSHGWNKNVISVSWMLMDDSDEAPVTECPWASTDGLKNHAVLFWSELYLFNESSNHQWTVSGSSVDAQGWGGSLGGMIYYKITIFFYKLQHIIYSRWFITQRPFMQEDLLLGGC